MSGPELYTVPYDERGVEQRLPAEPCTVSRCWAYRMAIVARRYAAWRVRNCDTNIFILKENMGRARRIHPYSLCPYTYAPRLPIPAVRLTNTIAFILNSLVCGGATSSFVRWEDADV